MIDPQDTGQLAQDVGRRLKQIREILGLSQMEFGLSAGLGQTRYHNYESGDRLLTLKAAFLLCEKYSLTLDWLYMGDPSGLPYRLHDQLKSLKKK